MLLRRKQDGALRKAVAASPLLGSQWAALATLESLVLI